jgi:phosphate transport system substrate-binding protein
MNGFSDLASTTRPLYYRHKESGYVEIPFCRDPIAIITHVSCTVRDITANQVQGIFSGEIKNWKELGGPDEHITVIVPGKDTGAYKNFDRLAMERKEILYDFMSYQSTMVIEAVKRFPWSVSFISLGATTTKAATKTLMINGMDPKDKDYPFYQIFYFVVKGEPDGLEKKFIDFALSDKGVTIIKQKGMVPVSK